jgi:23S rRNA (adenine2030-N6)-methyltransferase
LWYPIKGRGEADELAKRLSKLGIAKILRAELTVSPVSDPSRLNGSGLILVNPPWTLEAELSVLLPALVPLLERQPKGGGFRLDWLRGEDTGKGPSKNAATSAVTSPRRCKLRARPVSPLSTGLQLVCSSVLGDVPPPVGGRRNN